MGKIARSLTEKIVPDEYKDDDEQIEVASYGMEGLLCNSATIGFAFLMSLLFHTTKELCLFLLFFVPLRSSYKSFHCKTFLKCFIFSNLVILLAMMIIKNNYYFTGAEIICLCQIWINYYLSSERNILFHLILSMIICLVFISFKTYLITIMISLFINIILLLLKRGEKNENI